VHKKVAYLAAHLHSCRAIAVAFNLWHGHEITVGKTWVWEFAKKHAAEIDALRRERKRRRPPLISTGHTWALDLTYFVSPSGSTFTVLGILDAGSRKLLRLVVLPRKCAFTLLGHMMLAFAEHGSPYAIRTDNESMFTGAVWRTTLQALAIAHRRGPPGQPWRNGRIERLFGTLKAALLDAWSATSEGLQSQLDEFAKFYNEVRPHQALDGLTPAQAWDGVTLAHVREELADRQGQGDWVEALEGRLVAFHLRS
jgi:putative transposase